jgi:putative transposase
MLYKTMIVPVNCNKSDYNYLMQCNKYSGIVWNTIVKMDKENREKYGKSLTRSELQHSMKKSVPIIMAISINYVILKYITARDAMFRSMKAKHKNSNTVRLPYKEKKFYNTIWSYQNFKINISKNYITLGKPILVNDNGKNRKQKPIKCNIKNIPNNIVEIELIYRNGLKLAIKYKEENNNVLIQSNNEAAIDLGEIHSITSIDSNGNAIIITGRKIRAIKQLRNKELAKLKSRRSKCAKRSKQYKKYSKAIYNLKYNTDNRILDCVHKITKLYLDYCLQNNISKVYYGDLDNCTRSTKENNQGNTMVRQKLSQWCYGLIMLQLQNKLSRYGIELVKVKEYYTSKKCPICSKLNKPNGRNYECECGYKMHRDVNGAINILNDNSNWYVDRYTNLKYLRIA